MQFDQIALIPWKHQLTLILYRKEKKKKKSQMHLQVSATKYEHALYIHFQNVKNCALSLWGEKYFSVIS